MITINGCEVIQREGTFVKFKVKCSKCNNTNDKENTINLTKGITEVTTKQCAHCGNNQTIKLKY